MKKILFILLMISANIFAQDDVTICQLPLTTTGSVNDYLIKNDSDCNNVNGTKGMLVGDFIGHYLSDTSVSSSSGAPIIFARAATTASLTVTYSTNTITATSNGRFAAQDGVTLYLGDVLLVKNQTNTKLQNGAYSLYDTGTVSSTAKLVRLTNYNETSEIFPSQVNVTEGSVNAGRYYLQTTVSPVIGTSEIVYVSTPAPATPVYPVAFVDVFTVTDLPNSPVYADGTNVNNPGLNAVYTATTNGAFPSLQGITPQNGTKILVRAQTDSTKNGDFVFLNPGSASSKYKIKRINYTAKQLYPKLWEVSQGTSKGLLFQQNNSGLVTSAIGTSGNIYFTNITPASVNIYNTDGAQDDALRTVTVGTNTLTFTGSPNSKFSADCDYNYIGNGSNALNYINGSTSTVEAAGPVNLIGGTSISMNAPTIKMNPPSGVIGVVIGANSPNASALLDLTATTKGLLLPRMTTTQRDAISSPANGLIIYNSTTGLFNGYQNSVWDVVGIPTPTITLTGAVTGSGTGSFATSLGSFSSSNLSTALTDETGSGSAVFSTSPSFTTPLLGTPTSGVLTNCTGTASGLTSGTCTTIPSLSGDVTSSGNVITLATQTLTPGSYTYVTLTVDAKGRVIAIANGTTPSNIATANLTATATHTLNLNGWNQFIKNGELLLYSQGNTSGTYAAQFYNSDEQSILELRDNKYIGMGYQASTQPNAPLDIVSNTPMIIKISKNRSAVDIANTTLKNSAFISIGGGEYGTTTGLMRSIAWGYNLSTGTTTINSPCYTTFTETSTSGNTKGNYSVKLRDVTTDTEPTDKIIVKSSGAINFVPITSTQASAITPAEGDVVMVSDTNGTFLTVGLWGYQGGLWVKM